MRRFSLLVMATILATTLGCRAQQLARDQDHIRTAVLDLHTNQIMDNLIRIRQGLPIIQLDYIHMTGTVTDTAVAGVSGSDTDVGGSAFAVSKGISSLSGMTRTFTNLFAYSTNGTQVNQLTLTAEPVLNDPQVYNAYLLFLKDPAHLMETAERPSPDEALIVRCRNRGCCDPECCDGRHGCKLYYWVPCAYKEQFLKLALFAVALRGQPATVSPTFDVTVKGVLAQNQVNGEIWELLLKIDQKIPNDVGYMNATIDGKLLQSTKYFTVVVNGFGKKVPVAQPENLSDEQKTDEITIRFNLSVLSGDPKAPLKIADVIKALSGQKVSFRLENFVPSGGVTDRLLEDIRYQLELNRLGQFQLAR